MKAKMVVASVAALCICGLGWCFLNYQFSLGNSNKYRAHDSRLPSSMPSRRVDSASHSVEKVRLNPPEQDSDIFEDNMSYDSQWCNSIQLTEEASEKAKEDHDSWLKDHGYIMENKNAYSSYSQDTLEQLMNQGDTTAMAVLATSGADDIKLQAAYESAVYGSTGPSLLPIMLAYEAKARAFKESGQLDKAKEMYLRSLAWHQFTALRGDYMHIEGTVYRLRKGRAVTDVDASDYDEIERIAANIYKKLNDERVKRRLKPFNDSAPKVVENLNNLALASMAAKGWDGWGSHLVSHNECIKKNVMYLSSRSE
ncbi:hypothetical protein [Gilvimarinus sp. 1_MG-2023]|uniref:hypothetical protein n=1 Tax=Gilvimarinus sp. 1_MG-2023 TaxID=3062638 RepID=UPI0026E3005A|nr:hypothetical protein [Gilvimarinus sp. 1_MG-2023]MDO6746172.1 hypothetical protein [Gilvimarinus sp. 1_MG-2023]